MIFIGIDPGSSGAVAAIDENRHVVRLIKNDTTERDLYAAFCDWETAELSAVIEAVHSMPKQGVASSFKFGTSYGLLRGFLIASCIPFVAVSPQRWQKRLGCLTHGDKNVSKQFSQQLFPSTKITHATADALLLAECARQIWKD